MERYIYLLLVLLLLAALTSMLWARRDLRNMGLSVGLAGGLAGLISEIWFFRDYWRPPTLLGVAHISPEDFLFGFAIGALAAVVYPALTRRRLVPVSRANP